MIDRLDRLAALLRDDASYCRLATLIEQSAYSEPADPLAAWPRYWIGPFPAVGVVPLPYETVVRVTLRRGTEYGPKPVDSFCWGQSGGMADIVAFSYLADNPEGWVERPEGWVPPDSAWPLEWKLAGEFGSSTGPLRTSNGYWDAHPCVTHIRLLPREAATPKPAPIPDDVREVVREALEVSQATLVEFSVFGPARNSIKTALDALAALDASPAGKVVGYAIEFPWGIASGYFDTAEAARKEASGVSDGRFRIVRLVEVDDDE